jgi:hypothetical protein
MSFLSVVLSTFFTSSHCKLLSKTEGGYTWGGQPVHTVNCFQKLKVGTRGVGNGV